jgi:hypothetical protein
MKHIKYGGMLSMDALILATIAGCASVPAEPTQIQRSEVPIAIACKTETPTQPTYNIPHLKQSDNIFVKTKAILADIELHTAYEIELLAALTSCK